MEAKEFVSQWLRAVYENNEPEIYHALTKRTVFFSIEKKEEVSLEELLKEIHQFQSAKEKMMVSRVCVKICLLQEADELQLFFEIEKNRFKRIEFCHHC